MLLQEIAFHPDEARATLAALPVVPAVFALYGAEAKDEPYVGRTPNLRARLERLLVPSAKHPRRLQLAGRVRRIAWLATGSEFESLLAQFSLLVEVFGGERALKRMHLGAPTFVRFMGSNRYPRVSLTTRPGAREAGWFYGPFASRDRAERFVDETLKLFLLRRCTEELEPDPKHPGCVYSEMKKCLAPCFGGCTDERYAEESQAVEQFLSTRGESQLVPLRAAREAASEDLEFERAAALHEQVQRVEAVRALAPELVQPLDRLRAVVLQASATPGEVAVFLFDQGRLRGPVGFSTFGMRIQNEQSGSTSLFVHPVAIVPVPEEQGLRDQGPGTRDQGLLGAGDQGLETNVLRAEKKIARDVLVERLEAVLAALTSAEAATAVERQGHLALLKRWYYRPEARRVGEIFFLNEDGQWPEKAILRGIGRVAAKAFATA